MQHFYCALHSLVPLLAMAMLATLVGRTVCRDEDYFNNEPDAYSYNEPNDYTGTVGNNNIDGINRGLDELDRIVTGTQGGKGKEKEEDEEEPEEPRNQHQHQQHPAVIVLDHDSWAIKGSPQSVRDEKEEEEEEVEDREVPSHPQEEQYSSGRPYSSDSNDDIVPNEDYRGSHVTSSLLSPNNEQGSVSTAPPQQQRRRWGSGLFRFFADSWNNRNVLRGNPFTALASCFECFGGGSSSSRRQRHGRDSVTRTPQHVRRGRGHVEVYEGEDEGPGERQRYRHTVAKFDGKGNQQVPMTAGDLHPKDREGYGEHVVEPPRSSGSYNVWAKHELRRELKGDAEDPQDKRKK